MSTNDTTIQLRVDVKTKKQVKKTLEDLGLDLSSAIKLFLKSVIATESIPFEVLTENGYTLREEKEMVKEAEYALKHGKRYATVEELMKDLN